MKYYIDRVWYCMQADTWFSYENPIEYYYDSYEEALAECDYLNETKIFVDYNEKFEVMEVEE